MLSNRRYVSGKPDCTRSSEYRLMTAGSRKEYARRHAAKAYVGDRQEQVDVGVGEKQSANRQKKEAPAKRPGLSIAEFRNVRMVGCARGTW